MPIDTNHVTNTLLASNSTLNLSASKYRLNSVVYDDMQGSATSVAGGSALGTLTVRDTQLTINCFQNADNDILHMVFQFSHAKQLDVDCGGFHLHCYLPNAPVAGNTLNFNYWYMWINADGTIPALANWTSGSTTFTFTTETQYQCLIVPIVPTLTKPVNEKASSLLIVKVQRISTGTGADTYNSDLGLLYADVHYPIDRFGSNTAIGEV